MMWQHFHLIQDSKACCCKLLMSLLLIWFWINSNRESSPALSCPLSPWAALKHTQLISRPRRLSPLSSFHRLILKSSALHGEHLSECLSQSVCFDVSLLWDNSPPPPFLYLSAHFPTQCLSVLDKTVSYSVLSPALSTHAVHRCTPLSPQGFRGATGNRQLLCSQLEREQTN